MKKIFLLLIILLFTNLLFATKYAGEIFQLSADVRGQALGNTGLTDHQNFAAAFWNPALLSQMKTNRFELMHSEEYGGLLNYDTFSASFGAQEKLAFTITRIGVDDIPLTKLEDPQDSLYYGNRPYKYKTVNNSDYVAYFGFTYDFYRYKLGIVPKFAYRNLAGENGYGFGADVSSIFHVRNNLVAALKLRDVFTTQIFWSNGTREFVNPSLDSEISYNFKLPLLDRMNRIALRCEIYGENRDSASAIDLSIFSVDPHFGWEIKAHPNVDLLAGYDRDNLTAGVTLRWKKWYFNYAFIHDTELENSQRISIGFLE